MMKTLARLLLVAALAALPGALALGESVAVDGSNNSYEAKIEATVGGKAVKMDLTGAALRKRVVFKVYTIGSYVQSGSGLHSAQALADADVPKQLHLVMERDVDGKEMVDAVEKAIHNSRGNNAFADELKTMRDTMKTLELKKGDNIRLTNIPKKGLSCDVAGKKQILIENPDFSKAVWEIYLGKKNIDDDIKKALVSRL